MSARASVIAYGKEGRYQGALASRPMPVQDAGLDALPQATRETLAAVWQVRAAMERRVADSFQVIEEALRARNASDELVALAHRAIDDEHRHAELSRQVASRYAARVLPAPERLPLTVPRLEGTSPAVRHTLHVVGQCILNETTAAAYLELCLHQATGATALWGLRELLADEVDHGRIGWAHLASLPLDERRSLSPWLLPLSFLNLRAWRRETVDESFTDPVFAQHGAPSADDVETTLSTALDALILRGFAQLDLDTSELRAWLDDGAPTGEPPTALSRTLTK